MAAPTVDLPISLRVESRPYLSRSVNESTEVVTRAREAGSWNMDQGLLGRVAALNSATRRSARSWMTLVAR
jgi:hypothetical protein